MNAALATRTRLFESVKLQAQVLWLHKGSPQKLMEALDELGAFLNEFESMTLAVAFEQCSALGGLEAANAALRAPPTQPQAHAQAQPQAQPQPQPQQPAPAAAASMLDDDDDDDDEEEEEEEIADEDDEDDDDAFPLSTTTTAPAPAATTPAPAAPAAPHATDWFQ